MNIQEKIEQSVIEALKNLFQITIEKVELQATRKEFEGDLTLVVFPYLRQAKMNPVQLAEALGQYISENSQEVAGFNVVKGFLNFEIETNCYKKAFLNLKEQEKFGFVTPDKNTAPTVVEYSSPNTNKPLHLGHVRNNLLGFSVAELLTASGKNVLKTQIINDRGIHICKSMVAWLKFGEGETPESSNLKGDKLVGKYYVAFDKAYKEEIKSLIEKGLSEEEAKKQAPIFLEAQEMLIDWENGKEEVIKLWETMNNWVYKGFESTYKDMGVGFDFVDYESKTYLLGKDIIEQGLEKGVFYKKEDNSVWCDLTADGLDEKLVLRGDGTSVYMTQDIGTAVKRYEEHGLEALIYTVGNEQNYHFKVLFLILSKLGYSWAEKLYHLSYGMVDLPSGKMKSREGTVVDADDLMQEMYDTAKEIAQEAGKSEGMSEEDKNTTFKMVGLGALKYYILKVDPKKRISFDPKESVDFNGNTGPFIQYTHARICKLLRDNKIEQYNLDSIKLEDKEVELIKKILDFPNLIQQAAKQFSPALVANYVYDLVKMYNSYYQSVSIAKNVESPEIKSFRLELSKIVARTLNNGMSILGVEVPQRM